MPPDIIKQQQEVALKALIEKHLEEVEHEYEMGGLSTGLYGDYATEVAKRVVANIGRELEARCEGEYLKGSPMDDAHIFYKVIHFNEGLTEAKRIIRSITGINPTR